MNEVAIPMMTAGSEPSRTSDRLLKGYLHKTSNTLCGIKGYASLIADPTLSCEHPARWARKIIAEVEKMEKIYRSVGDLTRPRSHPDLGIDLPALLEDLFTICETKCEGLTILKGRIPEGDLLLPKADLGLVLTEVICNSSEGEMGISTPVRVVVTAEVAPGGRMALTVKDDGPGMRPEILNQATDPFLTTKEGHLGVGLSRVETLLEMYGLSWTLESEPGTGTTFTCEVAEVITD